MNPNPISQSQHQESTSLSIKRRGGKDEEKNKNPLLGDSEELVRGGGIQRVDEVGEHQRQDHQKVRDALVDGRCCKYIFTTNRSEFPEKKNMPLSLMLSIVL